VLFIEKEGFLPLFERVKLAERYDIAIMSTKGMSVTASRLLVDRLCAEHQVPLLVLRDFDKAGFSIAGTLRRSTRRYQFQNTIQVVDLGLRLTDVTEWKLESESVFYGQANPKDNLRRNGATAEEIEFLLRRRVELNAFSSGDLIRWIEDKLREHGVAKIIPDDATLAAAYRRTLEIRKLQMVLAQAGEQIHRDAEAAQLPDGLREQVQSLLGQHPAIPWDAAIARLARRDLAS
jgi:hypothetical protein